MRSFDVEQKRRRRRAAAGAVGLFVIGALFGAYLFLEFPFDLSFPDWRVVRAEPTPTPPAVDVVVPREDVVAADAAVEWLARFSECEHEAKLDAQGDLAGMARGDVARNYPDYAIELFDPHRVRLVRLVEGYCPAHYTLSLGEEALIITRTDLATLGNIEVMRVIIDTGALAEESLAALEKGVTFDSLEQINAYLEGAE